MSGPSRFSQHYWLTNGMARSVGINLSHEIRSGRLAHKELQDTVARCALCPNAGQCAQWMGHQCAVASDPPAYCEIRDDLRRLTH
jgi:hypothetical protein